MGKKNKVGLQQKATQKLNDYVQKASDKFASMPINKQCKTYLSLITVNKLAGVDVHASLLKGMKEDYEQEITKNPISVEDWLKLYFDEPLFADVMKRCKTNQQELTEMLKGGCK